MNRYLLILILATTQLFALESVTYKAKQKKDFVLSKFLLKSPMRGQESAKRRKLKQDYITRIIIESNNQVIYNIYTTPNISKNPIFKFRFRNPFYNDNIKFTIINNKNKKTEKVLGKNNILKKWEVLKSTVQTNSSQTNEGMEISEKLWSISNIDEAIKELYGDGKFSYKDEIQVVLPKFSSGSRIPIDIRSTLDLESIAIFHDNDTYPTTSTIAVIKVPSNAIIDYNLGFKMSYGCDINVVIVAKGKDGTIYRKNKIMDIAGSDMNCDGTSNGLGG